MKAEIKKINFKFYSLVVQFFFSNFARASAWLFFGTFAGGILGYFFQILMGRMLTPSEYGLFGAIMALFAIFSAPLATLFMVVSRKVSEYLADNDNGSISHFYYWIIIRSTIFGMIILSIFLLFASHIQLNLKATSIIPVYLMGVLLLVTIMPIINNAFLQGLQNFLWLSASNTLWPLLKIIFSFSLVFLGFGLSGALAGTILATIFCWTISYCVLYRQLETGRLKPFVAKHLTFKPAIPIFLANLAFTAMTQVDIVLVNYYFSATDTGLYAAASILGKAIMYLSGGVSMALFPMVAELHTRKESSLILLFQAIGLTTLVCCIGAIFYYLFGEAIVVLFYGEEYRDAGIILRYYGIAMLPAALVMVVEHFLIAKGRVLFAYLFILILPLQLVAVYFNHETLLTVVTVVGGSSMLVMLLGFGLLFRLR